MKTLLISGGDAPVPDALRAVIARGSTSVDERRAPDVDPSASLNAADRIVFWSAGDTAVRALAAECASVERREGREALVFVTTDSGDSVAGLSDSELYVWPRDEDRLIMAFMTGA